MKPKTPAKAPVAGKTIKAAPKASNKEPKVIKAQAKPMAKPAPAKKAAKAKSPKHVSPYGQSC